MEDKKEDFEGESYKQDDYEKNRPVLYNYSYYGMLGFQMIAVIGAFAFIGYKIDEGRPGRTPLYTALLSLAGVLCSLYLILRGLKKKM